MICRIKYIFIYCVLYPTVLFSSQPFQIIPVDSYETPLVVVLMVKDEVDVIIPTIKPFIDGGIDSFVLYDTGSTDGTQDRAREFFKKNNLSHAYVLEEPFVDFAVSRNRALDLAEQIFPNATFMVMPDAEWYIYNAHLLLQFCKENKKYIHHENIVGGYYLIRLITTQDSHDNLTARLIRCKSNARFIGPVHEFLRENKNLQMEYAMVVPDVIYFEYSPTKRGKDKSNSRWTRDAEILLEAHNANPTDARTIFYLAQTYQFLQDWEQAIEYYQKRLNVQGSPEEHYVAAYRIGCAIDYLLNSRTNNVYTWDNAQYYYLMAHSLRPHRAEPLIRIAYYYLGKNQKEVAFLFAYRASQLPYPKNDSLFVEKNIYDYLRYDILGQCALSVGEYQIGQNAVLKALKLNPKLSHLHHNLNLYLQHSN